jgi:hypothetical protein
MMERFMHSKSDFDPTSIFKSSPAESRAAAQRLEQERAEARRRELGEQTSMHNDAQQRISIWERLHALRLPVASSHPLLRVIAEQTHLTLIDVKNEQLRRRSQAEVDRASV